MSKPKILTDIENKADGKAKIITGDIFTYNYDELEQIFSVTDINNTFNLPVQLVGQLKFMPHGWGGTLIYTVVIYGATGDTYISTSNANGWSEWKKVTTESDLIANDLIKLTVNKTLYVATTGSDITGDGSSAKPFTTIQKAIDSVPKNLGGKSVTINISSGTYSGFVMQGFHDGTFTISGANSQDTAHIINSQIEVTDCDFRWCEIKGFNIIVTTGNEIMLSHSRFIAIVNCKLISSNINGTGINVNGNSDVTVYYTLIQNKNIGVQGNHMSKISLVSSSINTCTYGVDLGTASGTIGTLIVDGSSEVMASNGKYVTSYGSVIIENGVPVNVSKKLEQKADIKKSIYRQNYKGFTPTETLADYIRTQATNGYVYGSIWCNGASDMNSLAGFVTWKSDFGATGTSNVVLECVTGKIYNRLLNVSTGAWIDTKWSEQATTDKIDILSLPFATGVTDMTVFGRRTFYQKDSLGNVYINCTCKFTNTSKIDQASGLTIATIPVGFRPKVIAFGLGNVVLNGNHSLTQTMPVSIAVTNSGTLSIGGLDYIGTDNVLNFSLIYPTT